MKAKLKKRIPLIIFLLMTLSGLAIALYPTISNYVNERKQAQLVENYRKRSAELEQAAYDAIFDKADAYNRKLFEDNIDFQTIESCRDEFAKEGLTYTDLLKVEGSDVMGYIEIDKIGVRLTIGYGTSEEVLETSVGHMEGTSLPVGGENTHAVLFGHRGLPSAKLFTDLDQIEEGDTFTIHVLNRTLTYQVDKIQVVTPEETDPLRIEPGKDYITLVTCTPYAVNTHRLLIRGVRVEG